MTYQSLFSQKIRLSDKKKNILSLLFAEFAKRVERLKLSQPAMPEQTSADHYQTRAI